MKLASLLPFRALFAPKEKASEKPEYVGLVVPTSNCWLRDVFVGAKVRYDLLGFGPVLNDDREPR